MNSVPLLEIKDLSGGYNSVLFKGLNLTVRSGEIVSVLGENGSGKTTLIDILMGLKSSHSGQFSFFGMPSASLREVELNQRIGWVVSQEESYPPFLSIDDFFRAIRPCYRHWDEVLIQSLAERFSLNLKKKLTHLSLGEASKVKLIKALAHRPDLLVFDELTANLSEASKATIVECLLDQFSTRPLGILYFCHLREEALRISDHIFRLTLTRFETVSGGLS